MLIVVEEIKNILDQLKRERYIYMKITEQRDNKSLRSIGWTNVRKKKIANN